MKFSYTHEGKTYSVVTLKDDSVLEIRRGDRTFPEDDREDQQTWDSLDDWKATWPEGATASSASSASSSSNAAASAPPPPATLASTIIQRFIKNRHTNMELFPSDDEVEGYSQRLEYAKARLEAYRKKKDPKLIKTGEFEVAFYQQKIDNYNKFLRGEYKYPPNFTGHSYVYVSHDGCLHPVYHNRAEDVVIIRIHAKGDFTPEELGITADSKFYARDTYDDMFVPL
jgi:hypothetical protein